MLTRTLGLVALAASLSGPVRAAAEDWIADYDAAVEIARREGKNLLVDFTGSDWCVWCKRLDKEVFSHEEFLSAAREDFVLVALDFPHSAGAKAKVPNPDRNEELRVQHKVKGYPTVLLMTPDGEVFGQTGYQQGGAAAYVRHLHELSDGPLAELRAVRELLSAGEAAAGAERAELLERILTALEGDLGDSRFAARLAPLVRPSLEAEDPALRLRVVGALARMGAVDEPVLAAADELDPRNVEEVRSRALLAYLDAVNDTERIPAAAGRIDAFFATPEIENLRSKSAVMLLVYGAHWNLNFLDQPEKAREFARLGLERTGPDHKARQFFQRIARG